MMGMKKRSGSKRGTRDNTSCVVPIDNESACEKGGFHYILRRCASVCLDIEGFESEEDRSTWSLPSEEVTPPDEDFTPSQLLIELHELMCSASTLDEEWRQTGRWVCNRRKSAGMKALAGDLRGITRMGR